MSLGPPGYAWERGSYRLLKPNGRPGSTISELSMVENLRVIHDGEAELFRELMGAYYDGDLDLEIFEQTVRGELKTMHLSMAALAVGGWAGVTSDVTGRTRTALDNAYNYLAAFILLIQSGDIKRDQALDRIALYVDGGYSAYWREFTIIQQLFGHSQEILIPQPIGACQLCLGLADLGWQPIGSLIVPVHARCRCSKGYR